VSGEGSERVLVGDSCMRACVRADDFTAFRSSCGLSPVGRRSVRPNRTERYIYGRHAAAAAAAAAASRVPPRSGTLDDDCTTPVKKNSTRRLPGAVSGVSTRGGRRPRTGSNKFSMFSKLPRTGFFLYNYTAIVYGYILVSMTPLIL